IEISGYLFEAVFRLNCGGVTRQGDPCRGCRIGRGASEILCTLNEENTCAFKCCEHGGGHATSAGAEDDHVIRLRRIRQRLLHAGCLLLHMTSKWIMHEME